VFLDSRGRVKVGDFGIARIEGSDLTQSGVSLGTPGYSAPEVVRGGTADARSDVFALGAVFYELLTGRRAFTGKGLTDIMMAVISREPPRLAEWAPETPIPVALVVSRCLRKDPAQRYRSAGELEAALEVLLAAYSGD
jgi:serine/threonine-protein kinase